MTRQEHLLTILAEECAEVAQRCSKALRFGMEEIQEGQALTNAERIQQEACDLFAVYAMIHELPPLSDEQIWAKQVKVESFLRYSEQVGTLAEED